MEYFSHTFNEFVEYEVLYFKPATTTYSKERGTEIEDDGELEFRYWIINELGQTINSTLPDNEHNELYNLILTEQYGKL